MVVVGGSGGGGGVFLGGFGGAGLLGGFWGAAAGDGVFVVDLMFSGEVTLEGVFQEEGVRHGLVLL